HSPLVEALCRPAVVAALADRGLVETSPDEAEAVVIPHTATSAIHSRDGFYRGWGGWAWHTNDAQSRNGTESYRPGTVVVDIFDAWTKELVWHGSAHEAKPVDATASAHTIDRAVISLFKDYPQADREKHTQLAGGGRSPVTPTQPMRILFSSAPAILIRLNGEPKYEDVDGTELQRMINGDAFTVRNDSGIHYVSIGGRWLEASEISGSAASRGPPPGRGGTRR